jgi:hypothetical protein
VQKVWDRDRRTVRVGLKTVCRRGVCRRHVEPRWGCHANPAHNPRRGCTTKPGVAQRTPGQHANQHTNPEEVAHPAVLNPVGVRAQCVRIFPGCAARPWAVMLNPVGVRAYGSTPLGLVGYRDFLQIFGISVQSWCCCKITSGRCKNLNHPTWNPCG